MSTLISWTITLILIVLMGKLIQLSRRRKERKRIENWKACLKWYDAPDNGPMACPYEVERED